MSFATDLTRCLGCRYPVVQTAMGWVATPPLVAATTNAGGFGFLACATLGAGEITPAIRAVRAATEGPFGVNFHMFQPNADEVIDAVLSEDVAAVSYGRGPDAATIGRFREAGITCMPTVGAAKHAAKAVQLGANVITLQGGEGGGHTGAVPTSLLLPQVLDAVEVPVAAAGGFHDGRGLAAALAWGASGIAMGTRFLLTKESPVSEAALARYLAEQDPAAIRVTRAVDGLPQRFVDTQKLREMEEMGLLARLAASLGYARELSARTGMGPGDMLRFAWKVMRSGEQGFAETVRAPVLPVLIERGLIAGDPAEGLLPSGQVAALIDKIEPTEDLIARIIAEAKARIAALSAFEKDIP